MMFFKDKTVIVTGGGQGIGKCIARRFLQEGCHVVIAEADEEAGLETEAQLKHDGHVMFLQCDVADEHSVAKTIAETVTRTERIDVLVNNAGIMSNTPFLELSLAEWNRVIAVNLTGAFLMAQRAARHLRLRRGAIVNIASTRAFQSEPGTESYTASKGGIVSLTHALAMSLSPEVRVNSISPGWIEVHEWKKSTMRKPSALRPEDHAQHPSGRVGVPDDIASMAIYLAGEDASFITGANFVVDGGMMRKMVYV